MRVNFAHIVRLSAAACECERQARNLWDEQTIDIAPGAGMNYRLNSRWQLRAEYEYQFWLNSPGYSNEPDHQLRPNGVHIGIAFRPFR
jgi:hypothetical protein